MHESESHVISICTTLHSNKEQKIDDNSEKENLAPSSDITLICLVKGNAFPIDIGKDKLVGHLKDAIKNKKQREFSNIDADELKLWKVEIPDDDANNIDNYSFHNRDVLLPSKPINKYFKKIPKEHIHVIVSPPESQIMEPRSLSRTLYVESSIVEFWKKLPDAKIVFPIPQYVDKTELNYLESYSTIENDHIYLNKGVITDSDGNLYNNGKRINLQLPSGLTENLEGMLSLPDGVFFLGCQNYGSKLLVRKCYLQLLDLIEKGGPAKSGCAITGTPGIGKSFFGFYLLFYFHYKYPDATIVWHCEKKICYQFSPDGSVQKGDIYQFDVTLNDPKNFLLVDAQPLRFLYEAYKILLTSPKTGRYDEAIKWPGFCKYFMPVWSLEEINILWAAIYEGQKTDTGKVFTRELFGTLLDRWGPIPRSVLVKWNDDSYQSEYEQLISKIDYDKFMNSINTSGIPEDAVSGRLVYLEVDISFTNAVYRFASREVYNKITKNYEHKMRKNARDLILSCDRLPKINGFRGNLFEDFAHLELQRGGTFRVRCLNNNSKIIEKKINKLSANIFTTLDEARKECYNIPKSKTFASIDSFSLDKNDLALYQITVSKTHGIKIKGLNDLNRSLTWVKNANNINIYFVVPSDIFETFPLQKFKTAKDEDSQKIQGWSNRITQYALEIDLGITNKGSKKRSNDKLSGDDENDNTSVDIKDVKKRKIIKNSVGSSTK
ncbi:crinkler CRN family protein [Gigaspora margarita]|uniref:Crinkler CRN family protein n=1 Tax=Gigaspora margarita TaxID=4874 RepID=A0A8H4AD05_GIGMA|nr:crinkler CRN family protein [Gigaspora margarita]